MVGALWGGMSPPNVAGWDAARRLGTHGRAATGALAAGCVPGHGPVLDALGSRYCIAAGLCPGGGAELAASGRATAGTVGRGFNDKGGGGRPRAAADINAGGLLTNELLAPL